MTTPKRINNPKGRTRSLSTYYDYNSKEGKNNYKRDYRKKNPHKSRMYSLKKKFGISIEEYNSKLVEQGGVCECCGNPEFARFRGKITSLAVDHNHKTARIRGLLCRGCNRWVGIYESFLRGNDIFGKVKIYHSKYEGETS